jgi:nitrate reductase NapE
LVESTAPTTTRSEKRRELGLFAFLAFILAPIFAVLFVAGFGFLVWIWQMIAGPPGPPPP